VIDVVAIGSHPDDVELACGGTLAVLAELGRRIGIVHLTQGEAGTRGTVAERRREAEVSAEALGATALEILDCGDGRLRTGEAEEDALIAVLRRLRPEIVLGPPPIDRHPDHGRAHRLVAASCFYAGLRRRGSGEPHRPAEEFFYMQHDAFEPRFVVDVGRGWAKKLRALEAYSSQLFRPQGSGAEGPPTKVSSREFSAAIDGRARHYGQLIGAEFGEPFGSRGPLAVSDPWTLRRSGLR
jgi:N-acetylglucosamine malate deacetylase 1